MTKKKFNWRTLCLVLTFIFLYMPIGVLVFFSFNAGNSTAVFSGFSFRWYKELFTDAATLNALKNTLILAVLSSAISTIIGTAAAYGISKMKNKFLKTATMSTTQIPMINPEIVTGISMMLLFVFVANLINTSSLTGFWTVLIAHITFNLPYVILLVLPKFKEMDKSLPEAALDLGCTPFQSFFKVELPAIMPGIIAGFIMAFTLSIDDFVISYFTTGSGFETLPIRIYSMTKKRVTPDMYALSTLIFVTILVLLLVSNLADGKNKIELSKKVKKIIKIVGGSTLGVVATAIIVLLCVNASVKTITVNVYNWGEYIADGGDDTDDVNKLFEEWASDNWKEITGRDEKVRVQVNYTTFASNEDLYAKLANGAGGYDVIIPSDYMLEKMHKENRLQPLDLQYIGNEKYLVGQFDNMFVYGTPVLDENKNVKKDENGEPMLDESNKQTYGMAYTYGVIGIVYNEKALEENAKPIYDYINSCDNVGWELLFGILTRNEKGELVYDDDYKEFNDAIKEAKILQFNNPRDAFGAAMYYLNIDVNNPSKKDWEDLYALLAMQKEHVDGYVMDEIFNKMEKGEAWIAAYYAGDCLSMAGENEHLNFIYPKKNYFYPETEQGDYVTNIFADAMCIPKSDDRSEESRILANMYINFMMRPDIAYENASYIYYGCPYDYSNYEGDPYDDIDIESIILEYETELGKYYIKTNSIGEPIFDDDGNYQYTKEDGKTLIDITKEPPVIDPEGDYFIIYDEDITAKEVMIELFGKYQYKDLTNIKLGELTPEMKESGVDTRKTQLSELNDRWEELKIESGSMISIYIICGVIAALIVGYIVYLQIVKRKRRKLYWNDAPTSKPKKKEEQDPDFSATAQIAIEKAKKRDK